MINFVLKEWLEMCFYKEGRNFFKVPSFFIVLKRNFFKMIIEGII